MRRPALRTVIRSTVMWVVVATTLSAVESHRAAAEGRPDIILIVTDDQRADTMRYMPRTRAWLRTTYVNAIVSNPSCCPSRTSIMTGTYSHVHGVWTNGQGRDGSALQRLGGWPRYTALDLDGRSMAYLMQAAGYRTAHVGKFLNRFEPRSIEDLPDGWDRFIATVGSDELTEGSLGPYYDYTLVGQRGGGYLTEEHGDEPAEHSTRVLTDEAIGFIASEDRRPLFLQLAYPAPHGRAGLIPPVPQVRDRDAPVALPPLSRAVNESSVEDKPSFIQRRGYIPVRVLQRWRRQTARTLFGVDRGIDRVLTAQEQRDPGLANTLVVFMSDNGFATGEHRWMSKGVPYEGAIKVPLRVHWNGLPPGRVETLVGNIDVAATIMDAAAVAMDAPDSISLLDPTRRFLVLEGLGLGRAYCGVRTATRKFVMYATGEREYYNLRRDPSELQNGSLSAAGERMRMFARRHCAQNLPPLWPEELRY